MKINIILSILFISILFYGSVQYSHGIVGLTKLNGEGCVCHNISPDQNVHVWIEGPDSVEVNQTVTYRLYLTGGPGITGGFNAAARTGFLLPGDTSSQKIDLELTHTTAKAFSADTIYWQFSYTAPASVQWDTLYSVAQSVNNDGFPNNLDKWNFGANFPVKVVPFVPVELSSFSAVSGKNFVTLKWTTGSEANNSGFEIERRNLSSSDWQKIGFVKGNNNSVTVSHYTFKDNIPNAGKLYYRLKQIDYDGTFSYSGIAETELNILQFSLEQNYPNPFNPSTKIKYTIPETASEENVTLKIYDIAGNLMEILVEEPQAAGIYQVEFNGSKISSGVYFYTLQSGSFYAVRKFILMK